jgi:hypothetical protein
MMSHGINCTPRDIAASAIGIALVRLEKARRSVLVGGLGG